MLLLLLLLTDLRPQLLYSFVVILLSILKLLYFSLTCVSLIIGKCELTLCALEIYFQVLKLLF